MKADEAGIVISGRRWSASDFVRADGTPGPWTSKALEADPLSFKAELGRFLTEFFSPGASVTVHTSGSTGAPKAFAAEKSRMRASARATIAFLGLKPGSTNLLAMPLRFIAGKMVVVRSAECGLNLIPVEPCANPFLEHPEAADLCALTPMQAATVLANPATSRFLLESRAVILGGGPVDEELTAKLQSAKGAVYASYGMTETLSHVALRRLNGPTADAGFRALPGVTISLSALNTLQIDAHAALEKEVPHTPFSTSPHDAFFRFRSFLCIRQISSGCGRNNRIYPFRDRSAGVHPNRGHRRQIGRRTPVFDNLIEHLSGPGFRGIHGPAVTQREVVGRDIVWSKTSSCSSAPSASQSLMSVGLGWYQTGGRSTGRRIKPDDE